MRKINQKAAWMAVQSPLFACPVCQQPMTVVDTSLTCENRHQFDLAKKGTVNFLNKPVPTEYDEPMLAARRDVLTAGFFDGFLDVIGQQLTASDRLLDVGCGEGTPTAKLAQSGAAAVGFDISAPAINLAGRLETPAAFCVADLARVPFLDRSFSVIVDLFSPGNYAEFNRVLTEGGRLFKVIPQSGYLQELRHGLYAGTDKASYDNSQVKNRFMAAYPQATCQRITYDFPVDAELFTKLVAMTPLTWQAPAAAREALIANAPASVKVDVDLLTVDLSSK